MFFSLCLKLKEFNIPANTKKLYGFMAYSSIKTITIPKSIEIIDAGCFIECYDLEAVVFEKNSNLKVVNEYCFKGCPKLNEIEFPQNVEIVSSSINK